LGTKECIVLKLKAEERIKGINNSGNLAGETRLKMKISGALFMHRLHLAAPNQPAYRCKSKAAAESAG
jgi:hypothetical protein